jgi:hypothetical protein
VSGNGFYVSGNGFAVMLLKTNLLLGAEVKILQASLERENLIMKYKGI